MVDNNDGDNWSTSAQWTTLKVFFHLVWITAYYVMGYGIHIIFNMAITDGRPLKSISSVFYETDFTNTEQMLYALVHMLILSRMLHYVDKQLIQPTLNVVLNQFQYINTISKFFFWIFFFTSVYQIFSTFYGRFGIVIDVNNTEGYSISYYLNFFLRSFFKESSSNVDPMHFQEARNTAQFFLSFMYIIYFVDAHTHNHELNEAIFRIPLKLNNIITMIIGFFSNLGFFVVSAILSFSLNAATYLLFNTTSYNDFVIVFTCFILGNVVFVLEEVDIRRRRLPGSTNNDNDIELARKQIERAKSFLVDHISFIFASFILVYMFFQADNYYYAANDKELEFARGVPYSDNYWTIYSTQSLYQATAGLCVYTCTKVFDHIFDVLQITTD